MIGDTIARQGAWLFRWRSYILLGFLPLGLLAISKPEAIEVNFGELADSLYETACIGLAFLGLAIRAFTVGFVPAGTSGRNTSRQIADTLNTTGAYSLTRNPLYLGNAVVCVAIALFTQDLSFSILMVLFLVIYLERIIATEERFLAEKFGAAYTEWTANVPVFFPRLTGWTRPELPFSVRNVLRREYSSLFAVVAALFAIEAVRDKLVEREPGADPAWIGFFAFGAAVYLGLRWMKKNTTLLNVSGR